MHWYLETDDPSMVASVRHEFTDYLRMHAAPGQDIEGAVLAFAELVNNAFEHGDPPIWVSVDWTGRRPVVGVVDLGPGFVLDVPVTPDPYAPRGRGLAIAAALTHRLVVRALEPGGSRVETELAVERRVAAGVDPTGSAPEPRGDALLRSLVVRLAQEAAARSGPAVAETLIAQVGLDSGVQAEEEFRAAGGLAGHLTPAQLAACYVGLEHAIDGDFRALEIEPHRIVLVNRRCPFGEAVRRAPALCRMTSSVFGGIAARNGPGATVLLEERIAAGDHQCRVVIELGTPDTTDERGGHRYPPPDGVSQYSASVDAGTVPPLRGR